MNPRFYYSVCQFGAEKAVKEEVLSAHPHLRFAFSRPGFITFKEDSDESDPILNPSSVFSRLWGVSCGQAKAKDQALELFKSIPEGACVQSFERDTFVPGDEPEGFHRNARVEKLLKEWEVLGSRSVIPKMGEWIWDWIWIDEDSLFLGRHLHQEGMDSAPGNAPMILLPETAPSRAYLKLEEAIHRFKPEFHKGMEVLEVGCSPGGATSAMLSRGMKVTGIDPKRMDKKVENHPGYRHLLKTAKTVIDQDLKGVNPEWLVLDMNLAPLEALDETAHLVRLLREIHGRKLKLKTGCLTLKLNDWKFADRIPLYLRRVTELGFQEIVAVQLCSNRQEFFVFAQAFR